MTSRKSSETASISIKQRFVQNSAGSVLSRFVMAGVSLAVVPVIIDKLGVTGFGVWEVLLSLSAMIVMLQRTLSVTLLWKASNAYGADDIPAMKRLLGIGVSFTIALFIIVVPLVFLFRHKIVGILNIPAPMEGSITSILPFLISLTIANGINDTLVAVINGSQRIQFSLIVQTGAMVTNYIFAIIFVEMGVGILGLVLGQAVGVLINLVFLFRIVKHVSPSMALWPILPAKEELQSMYGYARNLMIGNLSGVLRGEFDKIVLASFASPLLVGYYGIATRLANLVVELNTFFSGPLLAASGALYAQHNWVAVKSLYSRVMTLVSVGTCAVFVIVLTLHDRLIVMWIGRFVPDITSILVAMVTANTVAVVMTGPGTAVCKGVGRIGIETTYLVVSLILNIVLTIILVIVIGPVGTVYASAISWVLGSLLYVCLLHKTIDLPLRLTLVAARALSAAAVTAIVSRLTIECFLLMPTNRPDAILSFVLLSVPILGLFLSMLILFRVVTRTTFDTVWAQFRGLAERVR